MEQRRVMAYPHWVWQNYRAMGTIEVTLIIIILIALVLMFKGTIVDFVAGILDGIELQGEDFDPTQIAK